MNQKRFILTMIGLCIALVFLAVLSLFSGSVPISVSELKEIMFGQVKEGMNVNILFQIRLPRLIGAMVTGSALALSGYLLQTFFHNPIAGPFVLGISSGAKLTVAFAMVFLLSKGWKIGSAGMVLAAFAGAMAVMLFVLLLSLKVRSMSILVVCGIMVGYICAAVTDLIVTFADDSNIVNLHNWSLGSLSGIGIPEVELMSVIVLGCFLFVLFLSKPIGALRLGEAYAASVGVNVRLLRVFLILASSLLAACVTAFVGPVSFVGIAVPHLVKGAIGTTSPWRMIPVCFLGGAAVTMLCDLIARTFFAPTEVSISSVTAVLLVPVVLWILLKKKKEGGGPYA